MSLLKVALPSDPGTLRAFAMVLPAALQRQDAASGEAEGATGDAERARCGRSPEMLDGEIERLDITLGELEEGGDLEGRDRRSRKEERGGLAARPV